MRDITRGRLGRWVACSLTVAGILVAGGSELAAQNSDEIVVPVADEPDLLPVPAGENEEYEVLVRGPVHEAFAEPYSQDPEPGLVIEKAPPEPVDEIPPAVRPEGSNIVWIPGYWAWEPETEDYIWVSGLWRNIPPDQKWTPGYWVEVTDGYQWVAGFWTDESTDELAYLPPPPESLEAGPTASAPGDGYFWVPGCWTWQQTDYAWRPGFWSVAQDGWIWVPEQVRWTPYGHVHLNGYWDYGAPRRGMLFTPVSFFDPYRARPYRYSPFHALNVTNLFVHLFVGPRLNHYYFGNYYGFNRGRNFGFQPWYAYGRGPYRYDPLLTYYRWDYGRRNIDFLQRLERQHDRYHRNQDLRPPHTWDRYNEYVQRNDVRIDRRDRLALSLTNVDNDLIDVRLNRLSETQRQQWRDVARDLQDYGRQRSRTVQALKTRLDGSRPDGGLELPRSIRSRVPETLRNSGVSREQVRDAATSRRDILERVRESDSLRDRLNDGNLPDGLSREELQERLGRGDLRDRLQRGDLPDGASREELQERLNSGDLRDRLQRGDGPDGPSRELQERPNRGDLRDRLNRGDLPRGADPSELRERLNRGNAPQGIDADALRERLNRSREAEQRRDAEQQQRPNIRGGSQQREVPRGLNGGDLQEQLRSRGVNREQLQERSRQAREQIETRGSQNRSSTLDRSAIDRARAEQLRQRIQSSQPQGARSSGRESRPQIVPPRQEQRPSTRQSPPSQQREQPRINRSDLQQRLNNYRPQNRPTQQARPSQRQSIPQLRQSPPSRQSVPTIRRQSPAPSLKSQGRSRISSPNRSSSRPSIRSSSPSSRPSIRSSRPSSRPSIRSSRPSSRPSVRSSIPSSRRSGSASRSRGSSARSQANQRQRSRSNR